MLGTSDTWTLVYLYKQTSNPAYYIVNWWILWVMKCLKLSIMFPYVCWLTVWKSSCYVSKKTNVSFKIIWTHREYQWEAGLDKMRQDHHWWCYRSINSVKDKGTEWGEKKMYVCTTLKPNIHKTSRSQWCPIKRLNLNHASKYLTWSDIRQNFMIGKKHKCWSILR